MTEFNPARAARTWERFSHLALSASSGSVEDHDPSLGKRIRENREGARVRRLSPRILRRPPVVAVVTFESRRGAAPQAA